MRLFESLFFEGNECATSGKEKETEWKAGQMEAHPEHMEGCKISISAMEGSFLLIMNILLHKDYNYQ